MVAAGRRRASRKRNSRPPSTSDRIRSRSRRQPLADRHLDPQRADAEHQRHRLLARPSRGRARRCRRGRRSTTSPSPPTSHASTRSTPLAAPVPRPRRGTRSAVPVARRPARSPRAPRGPGRRAIVSPGSITPPGGVQSSEPSRRRLADQHAGRRRGGSAHRRRSTPERAHLTRSLDAVPRRDTCVRHAARSARARVSRRARGGGGGRRSRRSTAAARGRAPRGRSSR